MKQIKKDELFQNLSGFLKAKGIALKQGSYTQRIRQGCGLLTDTINLTQEGLQRAKVEMDSKLDQMRQIIRKNSPFQSSPASRPASGARIKAKAAAAGKTSSAARRAKKTAQRPRAAR